MRVVSQCVDSRCEASTRVSSLKFCFFARVVRIAYSTPLRMSVLHLHTICGTARHTARPVSTSMPLSKLSSAHSLSVFAHCAQPQHDTGRSKMIHKNQYSTAHSAVPRACFAHWQELLCTESMQMPQIALSTRALRTAHCILCAFRCSCQCATAEESGSRSSNPAAEVTCNERRWLCARCAPTQGLVRTVLIISNANLFPSCTQRHQRAQESVHTLHSAPQRSDLPSLSASDTTEATRTPPYQPARRRQRKWRGRLHEHRGGVRPPRSLLSERRRRQHNHLVPQSHRLLKSARGAHFKLQKNGALTVHPRTPLVPHCLSQCTRRHPLTGSRVRSGTCSTSFRCRARRHMTCACCSPA